MSSNPDSCHCGHIRRIHFNPILTNDKRRPCSHVNCPCLDFKAANPRQKEHRIDYDEKEDELPKEGKATPNNYS